MAAVLYRSTAIPVFDSNGDPVAGALANFYLTGTLTETPVYSDEALTIEHTNPVVANASGVLASIYLSSDITYRVRVTDADGVLISDEDPYADLSADEILTKLKTVDGSGSGLDADKLRGTTPTAFGLSLIDDAAASNARTTLGLGTQEAVNFGGITQAGFSVDTTLDPTTHAGKIVRNISSASRTLTISPEASNAWPSNTSMFVGSLGTGGVVLARGAGVQLFLAGTDKNVTIAAGGIGLLFRSSADVWAVIGSGLT